MVPEDISTRGKPRIEPCPHCGEPVKRELVNNSTMRRFCNSKCRSRYHNRKSMELKRKVGAWIKNQEGGLDRLKEIVGEKKGEDQS